jgi:DNA-binding NtrC family response regulator
MTNEPLPDNSAEGPRAARILILEDSPFDADLAKRLMHRAGLSFESVVVDTMDEFTQQLAAFRPDVIVSDFRLQGFTGDQALRVAQQERPDIPYIFWSGALGDETAVDLIKHGATDYILKDRPARLPSAIGRALDEARQRTRLARIEAELGEARRLASLGYLRAAEQTAARMRALLDTVRGTSTAGQPGESAGERQDAASAADGAASRGD